MNKAIITGAANGIGRAVASKFLKEGTEIFACDMDEEGLKLLKNEFPAAHTYCFDIANHDSVKDFFREVENEECNWLVNNAGVYPGRNIFDYSPEDILRLVLVNNIAAVYFTQFFAKPIMDKRSGGAIVNISSVSGQHGSSDAVYGMTKAALLGLTKSTAQNFAPFIRVNAVAPGLVETGILDNIPRERYRQLRGKELLSVPTYPDDVAETVSFLLSDKARNMTGMTIDINNGQYLR